MKKIYILQIIIYISSYFFLHCHRNRSQIILLNQKYQRCFMNFFEFAGLWNIFPEIREIIATQSLPQSNIYRTNVKPLLYIYIYILYHYGTSILSLLYIYQTSIVHLLNRCRTTVVHVLYHYCTSIGHLLYIYRN